MEELKTIMQKFVASGWDLIAIPAQQWLDGKSDKESLISAISRLMRNVEVAGVN